MARSAEDWMPYHLRRRKDKEHMSTPEPEVTHVILVRHGQSFYDRDATSASADSGLTTLGWRQAHLVADWLAHNFKPDALLTSRLLRAVQTAAVIGTHLGLPPQVLEGIEESEPPYWHELPSAPDAPLFFWDDPWRPSAEQAPLYHQFRSRLRSAMARLMEKHTGHTVIVVAHGGSIGTIVRSLFGGHQMPIFTENGGVTHLVWQEGRWRLLSHNENVHLIEASGVALLPWTEGGQLRSVIEHFDHIADVSPALPTPATEQRLRDLVSLAAPRPQDRVIDAGTGAGAVALAFAPHVAHVTAVDVSPGMLERAESARLVAQGANVDVRWADAMNLPCKDASIDIIACQDLLHYVPDLAALFASWRRVLANGGKIALDEMVGSENPLKRATQQAIETQRDPAVARLYSESDIEREMRAANFRIERANAYDVAVSMEEWIAGAAGDEAAQAAVAEMMRVSIEEDATGLRIRQGKSGEITFVHRRLRLLARAA
jgi:broad specificity phosphatase PhoE/ubiquinone/menaquinone biosynthesis C-methylase UbiE